MRSKLITRKRPTDLVNRHRQTRRMNPRGLLPCVSAAIIEIVLLSCRKNRERASLVSSVNLPFNRPNRCGGFSAGTGLRSEDDEDSLACDYISGGARRLGRCRPECGWNSVWRALR